MNLPQILNSSPEDLNTIFEFYDMAIAHQKKVSPQHWQGFNRDLISKEIEEQRQCKILIGNEVAAVFAVTYSDKVIWGDKDKDPAIYIHRIVTHPNFRGYGFVKAIVDWASTLKQTPALQYIRLDTWADNEKLLQHYTASGFKHIGSIKVPENSGLPKHYEGISLNLFEIALNV